MTGEPTEQSIASAGEVDLKVLLNQPEIRNEMAHFVTGTDQYFTDLVAEGVQIHGVSYAIAADGSHVACFAEHDAVPYEDTSLPSSPKPVTDSYDFIMRRDEFYYVDPEVSLFVVSLGDQSGADAPPERLPAWTHPRLVRNELPTFWTEDPRGEKPLVHLPYPPLMRVTYDGKIEPHNGLYGQNATPLEPLLADGDDELAEFARITLNPDPDTSQ